ncbi:MULTISPECIES: alpha/beta fold hydrolase [unclassified Bradyrhizobium]|uniref:alpha/beta fold hydrolase n=1 Tax=unclassified Bradyrhizobium TaxID=2631580 RepID=UPI002012A11C|nr:MULTISPECIES: alpha/beta fold hydrolase [unclassified Bradyrhizobium]MBR1206236.1 alpha/beta fold hydrolase [Bradyrhizobium sp. AUGA SZCCT0124]MBR1315048.1 alpha/beta fold hydrolase [Bradyrhizobium sp. AUGA SZCCT0051]MBR1342019.1 alpha/beta fold hydrolase [Bradyrhizobium sp. AUGA SZCCT0105]MBR1358579.1 alpha/beta fold hydrolase [Bradyrhizobium sp. AUGA SZCCT0045]
MSTENRSPESSASDMSEAASRNTLALNPLVGIQGQDLVEGAGILFKAVINEPKVATEQWLSFVGELGSIAAGKSERAPKAGDKRFADPTWKESSLHSGLLKAYLAWGEAVNGLVDKTSLSDIDKQRAHLITDILIDAVAPTNTMLTNPAAVRKFIDTGGQSLWSGLKNYIGDLTQNRGMPSMVDMSAFKVGENLATTPGAVIFRNELLELIQYTPTTPTVRKRPLVITPPQINKYYALDLSPDKSMVRFLLESGFQVFAVSWRNPTAAHRDWGLDTYVAALDEAVDAAREISGSADISMMGSCSGGITSTAYFATLGSATEKKIKNLVLAVCLLDPNSAEESTFGCLMTPETMRAAKATSQLRGIVDGHDLARMFAWMRPNDLIWNYWVNNYLLGNQPPAFDILYWNADTTRLPAALHGDYLDLYFSNPFVNAGKLTLNDKTIDMSKVKADSYVVAGVTDHITPWKGVYKTAQIMGEGTTFVLSNSGHLQSLLNPPSNPKASFMIGPISTDKPDAFMASAEKRKGSWWLDWRDWLQARSGDEVAAPASLGSARYPSLGAAPGTYVFD